MGEICSGGSDAAAIHPENRGAAARGAAEWLCLAAAPTFAIMALVTAAGGGGAPDLLCTSAHGFSPFGGMVPMYLLMSAFHSTPWLQLVSRRRGDAHRS
jgi:hypothetical protein